MERLVNAALHSENPEVWIPCARMVLERTFGKPAQAVEVVGEIDHKHFVIRAPAQLASSADWEREYSTQVIEHVGETDETIDVSTVEANVDAETETPKSPMISTPKSG